MSLEEFKPRSQTEFSDNEIAEDRSNALRPESFDEFVGQKSIVENTKVFITAAKQRKEALDHLLLSGPPGLGKTTFAQLVSRAMGISMKSTSAPVIEKSGDMASLLSALQENDILFIDEIHRLRPVVEEVLYSAMEDYSLDLQIGQGMTAQTVKISLPPFTLIGATTKAGNLTRPLHNRFGIINAFQFYETKDLEKIVERNAQKLEMEIDEEAVPLIASRSRGTPRILNRLLRRIRDFAQVENKSTIDSHIVYFALNKLNIDASGLDQIDRKILAIIIQNFNGGPVGLDNLATSLGEDAGTIEDVYEPFLIQLGLIQRGPRGRLATQKAYKYLELNGTAEQLDLFDKDE